jgi:uncharacterized repeat protein (TIGR01451 family)
LERGLGGWGPERPTFTADQPSDYPVFNSIVGSGYGDKRNFLSVKEKDAPDTAYSDRLEVSPGRTYTGRIYYENAASPSVMTSAENAKVHLQAPATMTGAGELFAIISADNTEPSRVWDGAVLHLPDPSTAVALRYVPDSAVIHTTGKLDGQKVPETIFSEGAKLGCDSFDGTVNGKRECEGYVTFDFFLAQPNFTVTTLVASSGNPSLAPAAEVTVGDTITFRTEYKNTGTTLQNDVVLRISDLPPGFEIVDSPVLMSNSASQGYVQLNSTSARRLADVGLNIGSYAPNGGNCYIKFSVKITDIPGHDFSREGQIYTFPTIAAQTNNGTKRSGAKVLVYGNLQ